VFIAYPSLYLVFFLRELCISMLESLGMTLFCWLSLRIIRSGRFGICKLVLIRLEFYMALPRLLSVLLSASEVNDNLLFMISLGCTEPRMLLSGE